MRRAALRLGRDPARLCDGHRGAADGVGRARKPDGGQRRQPASGVFRRRCDTSPLEEIGPRIENDPAFPERINVNVALRSTATASPPHVGARRRPDPRLRHRRVRDGGRGDRRSDRVAGEGRHAGRHADNRLGSWRASADARQPRPTCSKASSTWTRSRERRDDYAGLPAEFRGERDDARTATADEDGSSSTAAPSPTRRCARPARRSAARTASARTRGSSSPAAQPSSNRRRSRRCPKCRAWSEMRTSSKRLGDK